MKYYTGSRKRSRKSSKRKSSDAEKSTSFQNEDGDTRQNSEESLQKPSEKKSQNQRGKRRAVSKPDSEEVKRTKRSKQQHFSESSHELNVSKKRGDSVTQVLKSPEESASKNKSTKKTSSTTSSKESSTQRRSRNTSTEPNTETSTKMRDSSTSTKKKGNSKQKSGSESETEPHAVSGTSQGNIRAKVTRSSKQTSSKELHNLSSSDMSDSPFENEDQLPISGAQVSCSSMEETVPSSDEASDGWHSVREFLQQQVKLLMSPFEVSDCFELASRGKRRQKDHMPTDVIAKSLRKLNYKIEDELLKTLNRQAQRRITQQIQEIQLHNQVALENTKKVDETHGQEEDGNLESLKKMLESCEQEQNGLEDLKKRASRFESLVKELDSNSLSEEINHANKLLKKFQDKIKKQGFADFNNYTTVTNLTTKGTNITGMLVSTVSGFSHYAT